MKGRMYFSREAETLARRQQARRSLSLLFFGMALGAALGMLFAPRSGSDTRKAVGEALADGYERGRKATREALSQLEDEIPDLRKRVDEVIARARR